MGSKILISDLNSIGNWCIIGANSVVNRDLPKNCITVGSPAKIVKKYDEEQKIWIKITN